jgi:putative endonuclease
MGSTPISATKINAPFWGFMFTVYVLFSESCELHYVGYTSNLEIRLKSHNEFGKGWSAKHRPWKIIHCKIFENKPDARAYEKWLKTGVGREFIKSLKH